MMSLSCTFICLSIHKIQFGSSKLSWLFQVVCSGTALGEVKKGIYIFVAILFISFYFKVRHVKVTRSSCFEEFDNFHFEPRGSNIEHFLTSQLRQLT